MPKSVVYHLLDARTEVELKEVADDMADGLVFTNFQVPDMRQVPLVFPVVTTFGKRRNAEWFSANVGLIFEYMDKALPSLRENALPRFNSMQALNRAQGKLVIETYNAIMQERAPINTPSNISNPLKASSEV
jgi:hypothetical protein